MKSFSQKLCTNCNDLFLPTGPASKYCTDCSKIIRKEIQYKSRIKYLEYKGHKIGVGKGGANKIGENDGQYKNGISFLRKNRRKIKEERQYCERCNKYLINAGPSWWAVHHKDRNRNNNTNDNLELLCKRCHQIEHECHKAFSKVQRSSSNGVGNSVPEAQGTQINIG